MHAGAHRLVIDDFRLAELDGKRLWKGRQDKGHRALAAAFREAVTGTAALPTEDMLATMRATLRAAARATVRHGAGGYDGAELTVPGQPLPGRRPDRGRRPRRHGAVPGDTVPAGHE